MDSAKFQDSFQNFITRSGVAQANQSSAGSYGFNPISRNRLQCEFAYRSSWICGMAVDAVAEDMTRRGVHVTSEDDPVKQGEFDKEIQRLQVWRQLAETIKWSRLYGGSVAVFMIDGQDMSTPLRLDRLAKGQFKGLLPLDRWALMPSLNSNDLIKDFGPCFGLPTYYETVQDTVGGLPHIKIHYTRLIRLDGVELPYWQRISENLWGQSVYERLWDRILAFDSATSGAAQMVYKAHLRTYKVEGLREIISMGGPAMKGLTGQLDMIRAYQSNEGLTLMDAKDEFEVHAYSFTGLSDIIQEFAQQVSGALQIPMVRLLGQSPAGFSNGESDLRTYYDQIHQQQEATLRPGIETLYRVVYLSKFGVEPPKSFKIEFQPLWQLDEERRAQVTTAVSSAIVQAYEAQIIDRTTALKEFRQLSDVTGVFSNISDESITDAESDPSPTPEALGLVPPKITKPGLNGAGAASDSNGSGGEAIQ